MGPQVIEEETQADEPRPKPVVPQDLIDANVGSKNTIYGSIKSGQIETFRLGDKIIIAPAWVKKNLDW